MGWRGGCHTIIMSGRKGDERRVRKELGKGNEERKAEGEGYWD